MYKGLVTSGCSFSMWNSIGGPGWPCYLQQQLLSDGILSEDFDSFHRGLGGNGNMLIARNTYDALTRLLKKGIKGEDILCIVQWSSINRHQVFLDVESIELNGKGEDLYQYDTGAKDYRPMTFEEGKDVSFSFKKEKKNGYYLINKVEDSFQDDSDFIDIDKVYLKYLSSVPNDVINGLWNWTTLQNYCEVNNIKPYYTFMFEHDRKLLLDDELGDTWAWEYLRDDIKRDNVLISITKYLEEHPMKNLFVPDGHPSTRGHKIFSDYLIKGLTST